MAKEYRIYADRVTYKGGYPKRTKYMGMRYQLFEVAGDEYTLLRTVNGYQSSINTLPKFIAHCKDKGWLEEGSTHTIRKGTCHSN